MEEKQVTVKGGRKRKNLVKFYLNDEEYQKLCENAATFGRDKSKYLRLVIQWIAPIEPPSVEVKEFTRELRRLGVSMNQIASKAHSLGFVDELEYNTRLRFVRKWMYFIRSGRSSATRCGG